MEVRVCTEIFNLLLEDKGLALPVFAIISNIQPATNFVLKCDKKYGAESLAEDLGISRQMATRYMKRLKDLGIVREEKIGQKTFLTANSDLFIAIG